MLVNTRADLVATLASKAMHVKLTALTVIDTAYY
jgi:hypothetical protein